MPRSNKAPGCGYQAFAKASPSAPQGPVAAPRGQHSEVVIEWVCGVLCYCICNARDGLTVEL